MRALYLTIVASSFIVFQMRVVFDPGLGLGELGNKRHLGIPSREAYLWFRKVSSRVSYAD